ncbi:unnamed protein product, partial [Notodromas monacha]
PSAPENTASVLTLTRVYPKLEVGLHQVSSSLNASQHSRAFNFTLTLKEIGELGIALLCHTRTVIELHTHLDPDLVLHAQHSLQIGRVRQPVGHNSSFQGHDATRLRFQGRLDFRVDPKGRLEHLPLGGHAAASAAATDGGMQAAPRMTHTQHHRFKQNTHTPSLLHRTHALAKMTNKASVDRSSSFSSSPPHHSFNVMMTTPSQPVTMTRKYLDERNDIENSATNPRDPIEVSLPCLPGYRFSHHLLRPDHKRLNTLKYINGYPIPVTTTGNVSTTTTVTTHRPSLDPRDDLAKHFADIPLPSAEPPPVPDYVRFDKKTLVFDAFFVEQIPESSIEQERVHVVKVYYHLEDDCITVIEPSIPGFGLQEYDFEEPYYTWKDFNLGKTLSFFSRDYRLCRCDEFTAEWLASEGIEVNPPEPVPDPTPPPRERPRSTSSRPPSSGRRPQAPRSSGETVLRFFAVWDDRKSGGDLRPYVIHYYLSDRTLEVKEVNSPNAGREPFPLFLKRSLVVRDARQITAPTPGGTESEDFLTITDLGIGKTVHVLNRPAQNGGTKKNSEARLHFLFFLQHIPQNGFSIQKTASTTIFSEDECNPKQYTKFFIYDCDESTRKFAAQQLGETNLEPVDISEPKRPEPEREIPPHTFGIGTFEDSEQSCKSLQPTAPKKDYNRLFAYGDKVLRFEAYLAHELDNEFDGEHRGPFVIKYFIADDTIEIHELINLYGVRRKSRKFLRRMRAPTPEHTICKPCYYNINDFKIGSTVNIFNNAFKITGTDVHAMRFARENQELFHSDTIHNFEVYMEERLKALKDQGEDGTRDKREENYTEDEAPQDSLPYANQALILAPFPDAWNTEYKVNYAKLE